MRFCSAPLLRVLQWSLLRGAAMLVPQRERAEWLAEWRSESWHVREAAMSAAFGDWRQSWRAEMQAVTFCLGAPQDAYLLRRHHRTAKMFEVGRGSAAECLLLFTAALGLSYGLALILPHVRAERESSVYEVRPHVVLIHAMQTGEESPGTITMAELQLWKRRRQVLFDAFAFYRMGRTSINGATGAPNVLRVAEASSNLFELLGLPILSLQPDDGLPRLILGEEIWRDQFGSDPKIVGQVVRVGTREARVSGILANASWRLPGGAQAWLLEPEASIAADQPGVVLAHLTPDGAGSLWRQRGHLVAPDGKGTMSDFDCVSLTERTQGPFGTFVFAALLSLLALPATTSLPLGEYSVSARKLTWGTRLRRWFFLAAKTALLLPIVYFTSLDLTYSHKGFDASSSLCLQFISAFCLCLFGMRWILRDQRRRCPVCLGRVRHPAKVGHPSRTFLAWNGTEMICAGGHGLLHVPEMPTSWFSTQRWLYLDTSWDVLFAE